MCDSLDIPEKTIDKTDFNIIFFCWKCDFIYALIKNLVQNTDNNDQRDATIMLTISREFSCNFQNYSRKIFVLVIEITQIIRAIE